MKKIILVALFFVAITLINLTNIALCNAIEVNLQEGKKYLVFEPDSLSDDSLKVEIIGKCFFSSDSTIALMKDISRMKNSICPVPIFNKYGQITGEIGMDHSNELFVANNGRIAVYGQHGNSTSYARIKFYNIHGDLIHELEPRRHYRGSGSFSHDSNFFAIIFPLYYTPNFTEEGRLNNNISPGAILLYNEDFSVANSFNISYLGGPFKVKFSENNNKIIATFRHLEDIYESFESESYSKRTIIFDNKLNFIEEKEGWE